MRHAPHGRGCSFPRRSIGRAEWRRNEKTEEKTGEPVENSAGRVNGASDDRGRGRTNVVMDALHSSERALPLGDMADDKTDRSRRESGPTACNWPSRCDHAAIVRHRVPQPGGGTVMEGTMPNLVRLSVVLALFAGVATEPWAKSTAPRHPSPWGRLRRPGTSTNRATRRHKELRDLRGRAHGFSGSVQRVRPRRLRQSNGRRQESLRLDVLTTWDHVREQRWVHDEDPFNVNQFGHPYQGATMFGIPRSPDSVSGRHWSIPRTSAASSGRWLGDTTPPSINDLITTGKGRKPARRGLLSDGGPRPQGHRRQVGAPASRVSLTGLRSLRRSKLAHSSAGASIPGFTTRPATAWQIGMGATWTCTRTIQRVRRYGTSPAGAARGRILDVV